MREPPFWWQEPGTCAQALAPLAALYGAIAGARLARSGRRVDVPVICVGNLTVGGGGKTPTAIAIARMLLGAGRRPAFLTRGYGGRCTGPALVAPNGNAVEFGDEPLLLARIAPTIVARDRYAGARAAVDGGADVIVMDDGLQNPALTKTVALVALDGRRGIGNGWVIPAGPLRAPLARQLEHVSALIVIGEAGDSARDVIRAAEQRGLPLFSARLEPAVEVAAALKQRPVLAYAGIADPEKFFATLAHAEIAIAHRRSFPDHYVYTAADADSLLAAAARDGLSLTTTEKDAARLSGCPALSELAARSIALPITLVLEDEGRLRAFFAERTGLAL
ncbi:MAG: tetraacyldisaccharide 4'-kinase [Xanthobacteraceae bacterium]